MWTTRLVGIGQHLRPAALVEDLDPVERSTSRPSQPLVSTRITVPFSAQGSGSRSWTSVDSGQLGDELRERALDRREQLEQLGEARDRVVARQELREDVAAADRAGEDEAVGRRRLRQLGERGRRADDLEPAALEELVDPARDGDRERELPAPGRPSRSAAGRAAAPVERDLLRLLVDR